MRVQYGQKCLYCHNSIGNKSRRVTFIECCLPLPPVAFGVCWATPPVTRLSISSNVASVFFASHMEHGGIPIRRSQYLERQSTRASQSDPMSNRREPGREGGCLKVQKLLLTSHLWAPLHSSGRGCRLQIVAMRVSYFRYFYDSRYDAKSASASVWRAA